MSRRPRRRARLSLPFALLAVAIVGVIFTSAAMSNAQQDAERNTELPEVTAPAATPTPSHSQAAATPTPTPTQTPEATPAPYIPDEADVEMLARVLWGEARGRSFGYGKSGGCVVRSEPR